MKRNEEYMPSVVDFAYEIISLHEENNQLRFELDHYKEMHKSNMKSMNKSIENNYETIGMVLSACIDPESNLNKGFNHG